MIVLPFVILPFVILPFVILPFVILPFVREPQQIIRNPEYNGSSGEDEESDHVDITPLISSMSVPIVTVPAKDKDGNERVEDEDEDEDENEDENEAPPGLEADESSSIGDEGTLERIQYQLKDLMKIMEQLENLRKYQTASSA